MHRFEKGASNVTKTEWLRENVADWPGPDTLAQRQSEGWRIVALEWQREVEEPVLAPPATVQWPLAAQQELPFGTRIAADCHHLEENPEEMRVLQFLAELIVQDASFFAMADALNGRSMRTRDGKPWNAVAVFKLIPRLIEVSPRMLSGGEWQRRKKEMSRIAWNS